MWDESVAAEELRRAFDLGGRVAVITGAGSGIGRASARLLAGAGAAVVCGDINRQAAEKTASDLGETGAHAVGVGVDVSQRSEVDDLVATAVAEFGRLDVMGNIAGTVERTAALEVDDEEFDRVLAVNLKGVLYGCQAAARIMIEQGSGSIINMASGAIDAPVGNLVSYAVSKAGVTQLSRNLAVEWGPGGVRVNAVAPGFIVTGMTGRNFTADDGTVDEERKAATLGPMAKASPLGLVGEPEDVGMAVLYLASDASRFVTGQILRPNGGVGMPW
jgi:3-oxoacyl-[acyl-carrier protein] reductase